MGLRRLMLISILACEASAPANAAEPHARLKAKWRERSVGVVAFAPDGRSLVTSGSDGVRLRNAETGEQRAVLTAEPLRVEGTTFSPDARLLFTKVSSERYKPVGTFDLKVWNAATGKEFATLPYVSENTYQGTVDFALSPDGKTLVFLDNSERLPMQPTKFTINIDGRDATGHTNTSEGRPRVVIWDVATWKQRAIVDGGVPMLFSPDGATLLTGSRHWEDPTAWLWNVADGRLKGKFDSGSPWMKPMTFSPDGKYLAMAPFEKQELYELASGRRWPFAAQIPWVFPMFSPDGSFLFPRGSQLVHPDVAVGLGCPAYDLSTLPPKRVELGEDSEVATSPDGRRYAQLHGGRAPGTTLTVTIHEVPSRRETGRLDVAGVNGAGFSPDGRWLALHVARNGNSGYTKEIRIVDAATARVVMVTPSPGETWGNHSWKFSPDGKTLVVTYHPGDNISRPGEPDPLDRPMTLELWEIPPR